MTNLATRTDPEILRNLAEWFELEPLFKRVNFIGIEEVTDNLRRIAKNYEVNEELMEVYHP